MEIWRDIPGYEGLYQVSNLGNVKSAYLKGKLKKQRLNPNGYFGVNLSKDGKGKNANVHSLVAQAFLNHKPCGFKIVVDHIDDNRKNNKLSNLRLTNQRG